MGQERGRYRKGDRENQRGIREVTEADRDREHVYHEGGRDSMGGRKKGDSLLAPGGHPSSGVTTE